MERISKLLRILLFFVRILEFLGYFGVMGSKIEGNIIKDTPMTRVIGPNA